MPNQGSPEKVLLRMNFKSGFFWLTWPFKCLILMILTIAQCHENLLKDRALCLLLIVKFFSPQEASMILKTPNETFLKITRYHLGKHGETHYQVNLFQNFFMFIFIAYTITARSIFHNQTKNERLIWTIRQNEIERSCGIPGKGCFLKRFSEYL